MHAHVWRGGRTHLSRPTHIFRSFTIMALTSTLHRRETKKFSRKKKLRKKISFVEKILKKILILDH